jgi:hypothetical protein
MRCVAAADLLGIYDNVLEVSLAHRTSVTVPHPQDLPSVVGDWHQNVYDFGFQSLLRQHLDEIGYSCFTFNSPNESLSHDPSYQVGES